MVRALPQLDSSPTAGCDARRLALRRLSRRSFHFHYYPSGLPCPALPSRLPTARRKHHDAMAAPARPAANGFVARARNVYRPVGFAKGYNFVLWFLFAGAMIGFCLARLMYLDYDGVYCSPHGQGISRAAPGECCTYGRQRYLVVGIKLHLYTILPAAFLACFQFVPVIRHKAILLHRSNGYLILLLVLVGTTGALMIARHSFGGGIKIQAVVGLLAIMFLGSLALALYNIKMLQIEQHRAWMLRAWFYVSARGLRRRRSLHMPGGGHHHLQNHHDYRVRHHVGPGRGPVLRGQALRGAGHLVQRQRGFRRAIPPVHVARRMGGRPGGSELVCRHGHGLAQHDLRHGGVAGAGDPCHWRRSLRELLSAGPMDTAESRVAAPPHARRSREAAEHVVSTSARGGLQAPGQFWPDGRPHRRRGSLGAGTRA